jgi:dienelactone hydrolase
MKIFLRLIAAGLIATSPHAALSADFTTRDVQFYSEAVACAGKLYLPNGYSDSSKSAAVVIVPASGATQSSVDDHAAKLASRGVVAMTFDYRGWGRSGGFLYFGEPVRWDDRARFTPLTSKMIVRRKRIDPAAQIIDIRNAMTYLQGEPGIDRARIGVWGVGLSADHAIVVAAGDARVKAFVAKEPTLMSKGGPKHAFKPNAEQQAAMIALARTGAPPANERAALSMNERETKLALAEYFPARSLDAVPATTAAFFIAPTHNADIATAVKQLKGPTAIGATANDAASWLVKQL